MSVLPLHLEQAVPYHSGNHKKIPADAPLRYKIYISPPAEDIPEAFRRVANACCEWAIPAFKIGANIHGILRPDKLVLYFPGKAELLETAGKLRDILPGAGSQGVPFTRPLHLDGLYSWAVDPGGGRSWRHHVAAETARALKMYSLQNNDRNINPVLQRLQLAGIDPNSWN